MSDLWVSPSLRLALLLPVVMGCRDVIGIETRSEGPPLLSLPTTCMECVTDACSELERACASDQGCAALAECSAKQIDDPAGRAACEQASPAEASGADYLALDACMRAPCQNQCTGIKGLFAGRSAECDTCLATSCETSIRACVAERTCERTVTAAYTGLMTPPKAISVDFAPGADGATLQALDDCAAPNVCTAECAIAGRDFACVGQFDWPIPETFTASVDVVAKNALTTAPIGGLEVDACSPLSHPCQPLKSATTDVDGHAMIPVPLPKPNPFRGYFRFWDPSSMPAVPETNLFLGRPLYGPMGADVLLLDYPVVASLASSAGTKLLPGRAQILAVFLDCNNRFAQGVEVTPSPSIVLDEDTVPFFPFDGTPPTTDGYYEVFNAAEGCHELEGFVDAEKIYRMRFFAAADMFTIAFAYPLTADEDPGYPCDVSAAQ